MNSLRADELRLILPFLSRLATVDFFGTDDFRNLVEVLLGFDDVLRDREDDDRDRPLFWATTVNGRRSMAAASATPIRLSMYKPSCRFWDYRTSNGRRQVLARAYFRLVRRDQVRAPGPERPVHSPDAVRHSPRELPKEVNSAVHLSRHAEFLSIGRTCSSEHFGVEIYWSASIFGARTIGRFSINVSSIDTAQH